MVPTLFVSIRRRGSHGEVAYYRAQPVVVDYGDSVAAPRWPYANRNPLDEVCEHHLATLLARQPHGPLIIIRLFAGRDAGASSAARLRATRQKTVAFWGYWTLAAETQNWRREKEAEMASIRTYWRKLNVVRCVCRRAAGKCLRSLIYTAIEGQLCGCSPFADDGWRTV